MLTQLAPPHSTAHLHPSKFSLTCSFRGDHSGSTWPLSSVRRISDGMRHPSNNSTTSSFCLHSLKQSPSERKGGPVEKMGEGLRQRLTYIPLHRVCNEGGTPCRTSVQQLQMNAVCARAKRTDASMCVGCMRNLQDHVLILSCS